MYYLLRGTSPQKIDGPFDKQTLCKRIADVVNDEFFTEFVNDVTLNDPSTLKHGQWAVIWVECLLPRPVEIVRGWDIPDE